MPESRLSRLRPVVETWDPFAPAGVLVGAVGAVLSCSLRAALGDQVRIARGDGTEILAEVLGFTPNATHIVPYEHPEQVSPGMAVRYAGRGRQIPVGTALLGRVLDALGRPLDRGGPLRGCSWQALDAACPPPLERARVTRPLVTGQRVLDGLLTCGLGQRMGIFAGSGVGKSTLLGEIARGATADLNVVALIGERGREVRDFLEDCLGEDGLARSVVFVATSDHPPLLRIRAAQAALAVARRFRDEGRNVVFILDSLTRLAMAQRELGLALGEPPTAVRGYPPSTFQLLASTVEQLGNDRVGSLTAFLTVLVDGDDMNEPIADACRGLLDGHIVLDRRLAERGHYPAVDVARSISRLFTAITDAGQQRAARNLRAVLATCAEVEDLVRIGAYVRGTSAPVDRALDLLSQVQGFVQQDVRRPTPWPETRAALERIAHGWPF